MEGTNDKTVDRIEDRNRIACIFRSRVVMDLLYNQNRDRLIIIKTTSA